MRQSRKRNLIPDLRIPKEFQWEILSTLLQDLQGYLDSSKLKRIQNIIRKRDVLGLLSLPEEWGLQSKNLSFDSVSEYSAHYQIASLLKKFPFDVPEIDRREAAMKTFLAGEEMCRVTNLDKIPRLKRTSEPDTLSVFTLARSFISRVLGQIPDWDDVTKDCRHGPGATLSTEQGLVSTYHKYSTWPYSVTKAALPYAQEIIQRDERWLGALEDSYREHFCVPKYSILNRESFWLNVFDVVESNRVTFVPKSALTERTIAIEPTINLMLQLGVDGLIRRRLTSFGIDLNHGQEKNQELARRGSIDGSFATLDLKAASDTVSIELCRYLLPPVWFAYLMALRTPSGVIEEYLINYEKISSMGNGFTFALESMIFASVIYGVSKHFLGEYRHQDFAVYGDDLVVRTEIADLLVYYLGKIGFRINPEKSFITGDFRESCGADWLRGHLVRPVFIDKHLNILSDLFSLRNRLKRKLEVSWCIYDSTCVSKLDKWVPEKYLGIIGPPSNEEFSTYRHISYPYGRKRMPNSFMWEIKALSCKLAPVRAKNLLFRRLMNPLKEYNEPSWEWKIHDGLKGVGGYYHVGRRSRLIWCITTRVISDWLPEYPAKP